MPKPFERKDPVAPEWEKVYAILELTSVGEILRDEALGEVLGRSMKEGAGNSPVYEAIKKLERDCQRSTRRIPNVGWLIVEGWDHYEAGVAPRRQRAKVIVQRALESSRSVNRFKLSKGQRELVDEQQEKWTTQLQFMREESLRSGRIEKALDLVRQESR